MDELIDIINDKKIFVNISDKTRQNYYYIIKSLKKKFLTFDGDGTYDLSIFNNEEFIMKVDSGLAVSTQKTNLVSLKYILDKYKEYKDIELMNKNIYDKLSKRINIICGNWQEETDKQTYITKYTIDKLYDIMKSYPEDSIEYLFFATSLLIPPRRRDWGSAIFVEELPEKTDERINYVVINENDSSVYLQFDNYKISSKTKPYEKLIDDTEYTYMSKYKMRINPNKLRDLLLNSYKNNPRKEVFMESKKYWQKYVETLYKGFDQNTFRHCFAQDLFDENKNLNEYYLKKIAWDFGDKHTHTMRLHYTNPNMNDEIIDIEEEQDIVEINYIKYRKELQDKIDKIDKEFQIYLNIRNRFNE